MKQHTPLLFFVLAAFGIAFGTQEWPSAFLFFKVMSVPLWAVELPSSHRAASYWIALCLAPVVAVAPTLLRATVLASGALLLGAVVGLALVHSGSSIANLVFHFLWVVGFHGGVPLAGLLACRAVADVSGRAIRNR